MFGIGMMDLRFAAMEVGLGYGVRGAGYPQIGVMRGIGYCPPGCMMGCCHPVMMCPPGCMGPCCINQRLVIRNVPVNGGQNMMNGGQYPPMYGGQYPNMNGMNGGQYPPVMQNGYAPNAQPVQQIIQGNQNIYIGQQKTYGQQNPMNILAKKNQGNGDESLTWKEKEKVKGFTDQSEGKPENRYKRTRSVDMTLPPNPYQAKQQVIHEGNVYHLTMGSWKFIKSAQLTKQKFVNIPINSIIKIKMKAESQINGTRIIKIHTSSSEYSFSVNIQEQGEWMAKIVATKLLSMGKICKTNETYKGNIDGHIIRKGFFGGWDSKYGIVSPTALKICEFKGGAYDKNVTSVPEIWTRFQLAYGNMLVVKMNDMGKVTMGVPVEHAASWLRGLFYLVKQ